jgi:hypothetical protein
MVKGESGILACCRRDERPRFLAAELKLEWPNGAVSSLFSAAAPEQDHQGARRRQGHDRHPRLDLRQPGPSGASVLRTHHRAL